MRWALGATEGPQAADPAGGWLFLWLKLLGAKGQGAAAAGQQPPPGDKAAGDPEGDTKGPLLFGEL